MLLLETWLVALLDSLLSPQGFDDDSEQLVIRFGRKLISLVMELFIFVSDSLEEAATLNEAAAAESSTPKNSALFTCENQSRKFGKISASLFNFLVLFGSGVGWEEYGCVQDWIWMTFNFVHLLNQAVRFCFGLCTCTLSSCPL